MATDTNISIASVLFRLSKCGASTCHICRCEGLNLAAACRLLDTHRSKDVFATIGTGTAILLSKGCSIIATNMLNRSVFRAAMLLCGVVD